MKDPARTVRFAERERVVEDANPPTTSDGISTDLR